VLRVLGWMDEYMIKLFEDLKIPEEKHMYKSMKQMAINNKGHNTRTIYYLENKFGKEYQTIEPHKDGSLLTVFGKDALWRNGEFIDGVVDGNGLWIHQNV